MLARVRFTLPSYVQGSYKPNQNLMAPPMTTPGDADYGQVEPANKDGYNCFLIFTDYSAGGDISSFCEDGSGAIIATPQYANGFYSAGSIPDLKFPVGEGINFSIVGSYVTSPEFCGAHAYIDDNAGQMSIPQLLGSVTENILPGINDINLTGSYANRVDIHDCFGPVFGWEDFNDASFCSSNSSATAYDEIGSGTMIDPYAICTKEQLYDLATSATGCNASSGDACSFSYELKADLDLSSYGSTFPPIGGGGFNEFSGNLYGNGYHIDNLSMTFASTSSAGLFQMASSGYFSDIIFNDPIISAPSTVNVGVLIGYASSTLTVTGVMVVGSGTGSVTGDDFVGGIVGKAPSGIDINNSYSSVDVLANDGYVGGIVAQIGGSSMVYYVVSEGTVATDADTGNSYIGGLVGLSVDSDIFNSASTADVTCKNTSPGSSSMCIIGGLVGEFQVSSGSHYLSDNYATGQVESKSTGSIGNPSYIGGFVGRVVDSASSTTVQSNYATGAVIGAGPQSGTGDTAGGFAGKCSGAGAGLYNNFSAGSLTLLDTSAAAGELIGADASCSYGDNSYLTTFACTGVGCSDAGGATSQTAINLKPSAQGDTVPFGDAAGVEEWLDTNWAFDATYYPQLLWLPSPY